jgi:thioredoxin reductase
MAVVARPHQRVAVVEPGREVAAEVLRRVRAWGEGRGEVECRIVDAGDGNARVDRPDERRHLGEAGLALRRPDEVELGDEDPVRERHLLRALRMPLQPPPALHRVEQGDDAGEPIVSGDGVVAQPEGRHRAGDELVDDGRHVGEPRRLDDDAGKRQAAGLARRLVQLGDAGADVAAGRAAEAAGARHRDLRRSRGDEVVVDRDVTELVDDEAAVRERGRGEELREQRRLPGAEEAGEDDDRRPFAQAGHDLPPAKPADQRREGGHLGGAPFKSTSMVQFRVDTHQRYNITNGGPTGRKSVLMLDVVIIGGSFAGLAAALQLARASRSVLVIDAGSPRNRTSPAAHGVLGWDGAAPADILARFRADLEPYGTVEVVKAKVSGVRGEADMFRLQLADGSGVETRRIVLAHGVSDSLPPIAGLANGWGRTVLHCPYCHGYEVKGQSLAVLAGNPMSAHQAVMLRSDWSDTVTFIPNGVTRLDHALLQTAGVRIDTRTPTAAESKGDGITLRFSDGTTARHAALFVAPRTSLAGSPAEQLGCDLAEGPMGPFVRVGPMAQTSVNGVFAAGDLARPAPNINFAISDGTMAGTGCHASLVFPSFVQPLAAAA